MLATLTSKKFSDPDWIYECKFDSVRALIFKNEYFVKVFSRNKIDISENYSEIIQAFSKQTASRFIIDRESVAFKKIIQDQPPFAERIPEKFVNWVHPSLITEVEFSEWTPAGKLRYSRFKGLRFDKPPNEITREEKNEL